MTGHTIYLIVQGIIHNTRMALSPVGTLADVDLVANLYGEPWWLDALAARDLTVVGEKQWFSHNYQLTGIEAYMDMYACLYAYPFVHKVTDVRAIMRVCLCGRMCDMRTCLVCLANFDLLGESDAH